MVSCIFKIMSFVFAILLWRSGYFYDRRTEEILQRHEETRVKEATKTNSSTIGNLSH